MSLQQWVQQWVNFLFSKEKNHEARLVSLEQGFKTMSAEMDALKAEYETLKAALFADLDALLAKVGTIGTNPDAAAMAALKDEMAADILAAQAKVAPAP